MPSASSLRPVARRCFSLGVAAWFSVVVSRCASAGTVGKIVNTVPDDFRELALPALAPSGAAGKQPRWL